MLSILIVNWNTRDLLSSCLKSIATFPPPKPFEVIVVDNASSDCSAEMVRDSYPWVNLIHSSKNTGYAAGNNLAFSVASGDVLLTLNPDTEFQDYSLATAQEFLLGAPNVGCVSVRQVGIDGVTQRSVRGFPSFAGLLGDISSLGRLFARSSLDSYRLSAFDYDLAQEAPQPMGTFLMFKRVALESVGDPKKPFDEAFPIFFNEVDLLYRLKKAGWLCWYLPSAHVLHHGGESTKLVRKSMIWESHRSLLRYLRKHHQKGLLRVGFPLVQAMIYASAFVRAKGYDVGFRP